MFRDGSIDSDTPEHPCLTNTLSSFSRQNSFGCGWGSLVQYFTLLVVFPSWCSRIHQFCLLYCPRKHNRKKCQLLGMQFAVFAMAKIRRIGHDHQAPFQVLVLVLVVLGISSSDTRRKQTTTWPIYPRPPIFLQILDPL